MGCITIIREERVREKHIHKFKRHFYKTGNAIFFCTLPDCNFKVATHLSIGKTAICNRCGEPFSMNEYSIRLSKPHCDKCHKRKDTKIVQVVSKPVDVTSELKDRLSLTIRDIMVKEDDETAKIVTDAKENIL